MPAGDLGFHRRGVCNLDLSFDVIPDHIKDCSLKEELVYFNWQYLWIQVGYRVKIHIFGKLEFSVSFLA